MKAFFTFLFAFSLVACSSGGPGNSDNNVGATAGPTATAFHYYKGGGFPPPSGPNWSNDMTINFLLASGSGYSISAKHPDALCFKMGSLSQAQAQQIFLYVSALQLLSAHNSSVIADAGTEFIDITLSTGAHLKYYFVNVNLLEGELYTVNNSQVDLANYLKAIESSLAVACQ